MKNAISQERATHESMTLCVPLNHYLLTSIYSPHFYDLRQMGFFFIGLFVICDVLFCDSC